MIEHVRSVVTDGTGKYRIVDLRPGPYSVTFTLPGFATREARGDRADGQLRREHRPRESVFLSAIPELIRRLQAS